MKKIGITGGIGSGKSFVCELFAELGVPVYYSDSRAKELVDGGGRLRNKITRLFGAEAYRDNRLNSRFVADKVFKDRMLLASLNAIVHPAVAEDFAAWAMSKTDHPYVLLESAILFESGFERFVDEVITVSAPVEVRIERVVSRDNVSRAEVMERIANQLTDEARENRADYTIYNNQNTENLMVKVSQLDKLFRQ
jgi:dephospho-CoA kinase